MRETGIALTIAVLDQMLHAFLRVWLFGWTKEITLPRKLDQLLSKSRIGQEGTCKAMNMRFLDEDMTPILVAYRACLKHS